MYCLAFVNILRYSDVLRTNRLNMYEQVVIISEPAL